jgi:hypothetical protein
MYKIMYLFLARRIPNSEFASNACVYSGMDYAFSVLLQFLQASAD